MKKIDLPLLIGVLLISLFGLIMIYSSSYVWAEYKFNDPYKFVRTQGIFLVVGYILMYLISNFDYNKYLEKSNLIFGGCFLLLILVLIPGIGTVRNGSRSWFGIGGFGIQPSEFTKLGIIIFTSKYLTNNKMKNIKTSVLPILSIVLLIFGIPSLYIPKDKLIDLYKERYENFTNPLFLMLEPYLYKELPDEIYTKMYEFVEDNRYCCLIWCIKQHRVQITPYSSPK